MSSELNAVTGAFGFSGRYITERLLAKGISVVSLTGHPERSHNFGDRVTSKPFSFDDPTELAKSLQGVTTLYNTYWIRFERDNITFDKAVANSCVLIDAAKSAGVRRIVHISITNPSVDSPLPYYSGKALVEETIVESGLSYAILRPNVLFGDQGILINNIAWFLRHLPMFGVPGSGEYKIQSIFVEDLADLAVEWGGRGENTIFDAVGPEVYTFDNLIRLIKDVINSRAIVIHIPPIFALAATQIIGTLVHDVVLTPEEVNGLLANLLVSKNEPTGHTSLAGWIESNREWLGKEYFSEVKKHFQ
ncbi:NAD(P)H-binding protein [bacterium]|nr:NAD(P)H-binding protein [bacterium]